MNKDKIIQRTKMLDEEKTPVSLRLPITLKKRLQDKVDNENISMNTLIVETLYSLLDDECGKEIKYLSEKLNQAHEIIEYFKEIMILKDDEIQEWAKNKEQSHYLPKRIEMNSKIKNFLNKETNNESTN